MAGALVADLRSLREELRAVGRTLAALERKLDEVAARSEAEISNLRAQLTSDQEVIQDLRVAIHRLEAENAELHRRSKSVEPEVRNAIDARNDAFRRLRHSRRVIKDVMEEHRLGMTFDSPIGRVTTVPQASSRPSEGSIQSSSSSPSSHDPPSSGSDRTARPVVGSNTVARQPKPPQHGKDAERRKSIAVESFPKEMAGPSNNVDPRSGAVWNASPASLAPSPNVVGHTAPQFTSELSSKHSPPTTTMVNWPILEVSKQKGQRWVFNHTKGPHVTPGEAPAHVPDINEFLELDAITGLEVAGLSKLPLGIRIHLENGEDNGYAFMYEPMFFEQREPHMESYLIDWAPRSENDRISQGVESARGVNFHTFICSAGEWFYIGVLSFHIAKFTWHVWRGLSPASRAVVTERIRQRNQGAPKEEIEAALSSGEWLPLCVKLERDPEHAEMAQTLRMRLEAEGEMMRQGVTPR